MARKY